MSTDAAVVTVTLNPAIDQTLSVPGFAAGRVNRVANTESHPAGKGVNVAVVLADLGERPIVTGFLGADNAALFERSFASKGIVDRFVRLPGETRTGIKIVDNDGSGTTDVNFPGLSPSAGDIETLCRQVGELARPGRWFVLSGSVPAGVDATIYARLMEIVKARGARVMLDTSGPALREALPRRPELVKPNVVELAELASEPLNATADVVRAARSLLLAHGVSLATVSMGGDGALFIDRERALLAVPPRVTVRSTVGAGDAMVAGLVLGQLRGLSLDDTARLATALGTHAVTKVGAGVPSPDAYEPYARDVILRPVDDR